MLVALVPGILVAADYSLWLLPLIGIPLVAIQLGSRQAVINEHEARHDRVTGLSNREDVARVLEHALHRAERQGEQVGVLMIGLTRFKEINETLGHRRGDLVLIEVARRLAEIAGPRDVAARLGGDEFALVLGRVGGVAGLHRDAASGRSRRCRAGDDPRRRARRRRARRHRLPPRARRDVRRAAAPRRRRARARQGRPPRGRRLLRGLRRARGGAAHARLRAQPRDRRRRARAGLPAAGRARDGPAARGRGARALAAPRARAALAGGVHRARRADRRDPAR